MARFIAARTARNRRASPASRIGPNVGVV
jgi:hypothetical protein